MPHQATNGKLAGLTGGLNALADITDLAVAVFATKPGINVLNAVWSIELPRP